MKRIIRALVPRMLLGMYHYMMARLGSIRYRHPSRQLIVIGVTGTKGKSTTTTLISRILEQAGHTVGVIATTHFKIGAHEWVNETKQTMPGRFRLQKLLRKMVTRGCHYAIVETSSEGIAQFRHIGIEYDIVVFTNISPEHIESHGSFENYREAKLTLFRTLMDTPRKKIAGSVVPKISVINADDDEADIFFDAPADSHWTYSLEPERPAPPESDHHIMAHHIKLYQEHTEFVIDHQLYKVWMLGRFNVANILAATCVGLSQSIDVHIIREALEKNAQIPGRLEEVKHDGNFRIFVDYAHEPASLEAAYQAMQALDPKRIIAVLGSQGGGRDKRKRPILGKLAAQYADYVIVTNEDPYDENPRQIIDDVAAGAVAVGKKMDESCFAIDDRGEALAAALDLAQSGDIVIVTGKGSETVMAVAGNTFIPWNDGTAIRTLLKKQKD